MSLYFSLRVQHIQIHGIDPETGKPPEGKMKELIEAMKEAKQKHMAKKHITKK